MTRPGERSADPGPDARVRHALAVALLVGLAGLLYLPGLGVEILRNPLEVKYALVARQMLAGGPLLVPHLFGELYPDKPPLYFWATTALARVAGGTVTERTARLPAALAALLTLLLVYRLGADLFGPRAGLLAAATLATSNLFFWYARQGHPDQFLDLFVVLACLALWRMLHAADGRRRGWWTAVAYGAMGLGVLSKGLLGALLPLLAAAGYLALTGPVRAVAGRLRLHLGLPLFLAVVLAWYGPAVAQNGRAYVYETLVHQHLVRYARPWEHRESWYYYLGQFPVGFFPGVLFLPGAIALGWRQSRQPEARVGPRAFLYPLAWFATGLAFLSLSGSKRGIYLLPLYPAAALMVGWLWDVTLSGQARSRWMEGGLAVLCGGAAALAVALAGVPRRVLAARLAESRVDTLLLGGPWQVALLVGLLLVGPALVWWTWRRGRPAHTFVALLAAQVAVLLAAATVRPAAYEARLPIRAFAAQVEALVPPEEPVLSSLRHDSLLAAFYIARPVRLATSAEVRAALDGSAPEPRYALVDGDAEALRRPDALALADAYFAGHRIVLLRRERP